MCDSVYNVVPSFFGISLRLYHNYIIYMYMYINHLYITVGSIRWKSRDIIAHVLCTSTCPDIAILQLSERINKFNDLFKHYQDNKVSVCLSPLRVLEELLVEFWICVRLCGV